jgi:hypothetical protein
MLLTLLSACAATRPRPPSSDELLLVGARPPDDRFLRIGPLRASVRDRDFVLAAERARACLSTEARALGASLVHIESVVVEDDPPAVRIEGSAYRPLD